MSPDGEAVRRGTATKKSSSWVRASPAWWTSRKPPPPGPVSGLSQTHEAAAAAIQASTALPPARRTSAPAAAAFALLLEREWGRAARWPGRSFAVVWAGATITGELPFALGIALALLALLALKAGWRWTGALLTLLVVAASPVALLLLAV